MSELVEKKCKICENSIFVKQYNSFLYCDKCKETDEYKNIVQKRTERTRNHIKLYQRSFRNCR